MATPVVSHHLPTVVSTQGEARRLVGETGDLPLLVTADRQTGGRGRSGRAWESAPRALAWSLAVAPAWEARRWPTIPLVAGLEARRVLAGATGVETGLKWPNDLMTAAGKVGGILVEASGDLVVIGVGVNLWWPEPPPGAASLLEDDPGGALAPRLAAELARRVVATLEGPPAAWGRDAYKAGCVTLGSEVSWEPAGRGTAVDVAADGGLVVDTGTGTVTLRSGEVHTVRSTTLPPGSSPGVGGDAT